MDRLGQ